MLLKTLENPKLSGANPCVSLTADDVVTLYNLVTRMET